MMKILPGAQQRLLSILTSFCLLVFSANALAQKNSEASGESTAPEWKQQAAALYAKVEAIAENEAEADAEARLQSLIDLFYEYTMVTSPEFATYLGDPRYQDRLSDNSLAWQLEEEARTARTLEVLQAIPRDELSESSQLNHDLLVNLMNNNLAGFEFHDEYLVISQLGGPQQDFAQLFAIMAPDSEADYRNVLSRMNQIPQQIDNAIQRMRKGLEKGVTPPKVTLRDVPDQIRAQIPEQPLQSPLLQGFANMPDSIPEDTQSALREQAVKTYNNQLKPAFTELLKFVEEDYLPGARESIAMGDMPDGQAWYAHRARTSTTTDMTPKEIHEVGLSEVKRIRGEMDQVIEDSGFEGSFEEFLQFLRTDPQFYYTSADELMQGYRDIAKRADPQLVKLFGKLPRLPYGVVEVPDYAAKSATTAYYQQGSLEAGRPGNFFANTYALDTRPKWEMEALTLHEAVPGHHFQIALAQEQDELPWFRRISGYTAFVEGWGLYSESLGDEMGFYTDPYSKFGQLTYEMWRAIRLVVDTGMHSLGWDRQRAIDYFMANAGKQEHDVIVEVDRYIVWPGQALAYKIGELKLQELRAYGEETLGEDFDIRAFHDQVLGAGALPLNVLDQRIRDWVDSQKES